MRGAYRPENFHSKESRAWRALSDAEQWGAICSSAAAGLRREADQQQRQANQFEASGRVFFAPHHRLRAASARREFANRIAGHRAVVAVPPAPPHTRGQGQAV